jgi:hypothetical protein
MFILKLLFVAPKNTDGQGKVLSSLNNRGLISSAVVGKSSDSPGLCRTCIDNFYVI